MRDRVVWYECEKIWVVDHDIGVHVGVVDARVLIVVEPVVQQRIAQAIVVNAGKPLSVGIEVLKVRLGPEIPRPVVFLVLHVTESLLIHARLVEPLVILFNEVPVRDISGLELQPQVLKVVFVVVGGQEPLHVADVEPAPEILERRHVRPLVPPLAGAGRSIRDDGRTRTEHVVAEVAQAPDIEVAEVVVSDALGRVAILCGRGR